MNIEYVCEFCDFVGTLKEYDKHVELSAKCDTRPACCRLESIKDYEELDADEICDDCTKKLDDYWEDFWTDSLMGDYYEG
jgi:hypothetical protein